MTQEITQHADPQQEARDLDERTAAWSAARDAASEARSEARSALRAAHVLSSAALGDATAVQSTMDVAATADPQPHQTLRYLLAAIPADVRAEVIDNARRRADDAGVAAAKAAVRAHRMAVIAGKRACTCCPGSVVVVPRPEAGPGMSGADTARSRKPGGTR